MNEVGLVVVCWWLAIVLQSDHVFARRNATIAPSTTTPHPQLAQNASATQSNMTSSSTGSSPAITGMCRINASESLPYHGSWVTHSCVNQAVLNGTVDTKLNHIDQNIAMCELRSGSVNQLMYMLINKLTLAGTASDPFTGYANGTECLKDIYVDGVLIGHETSTWRCWEQELLGSSRRLVQAPSGVVNVLVCNMTVNQTGETRHAIGTLHLVNSSPVTLGSNTTLVILAQRIDVSSMFILEFGDNTSINFHDHHMIQNVTPTTFGDTIAAQIARMSVNVSTWYVSKVQYNYTKVGSYTARVTAVPDKDSEVVAESSVFIQYNPCVRPKVTLSGGGDSALSPAEFLRSRKVNIHSSVINYCQGIDSVQYHWAIHSLTEAGEVSDKMNKVTLPSSISLAGRSLRLPRGSLEYGLYVLELFVTLWSEQQTDAVSGETGLTWIQINPSDLLAVISGGSVRVMGLETPLDVDGSHSSDPDDIQNPYASLQYTWYCTMEGTDADVIDDVPALQADARTSGVGCQGLGYLLPYSSSHISQVNVTIGTLPSTYNFILVVSKAGRMAVTTQKVTFIQGDPPLVETICSVNCGRYLNPSQRLILRARCTNCHGNENLVYTWSLIPKREYYSTQSLDWTSQTTTGQHQRNLVVNANTFSTLSQEEYSFRVTVTRTDGTEGFGESLVTINTAPSPGSCQVSPQEGVVLQTTFTITCTGFHDDHLPLIYKYFVVQESSTAVWGTVKRQLLYHGYEYISPAMYLNGGDERHDFRVTLVVEVSDNYGATTHVETTTTVREVQLEVESLRNMTFGNNNALHGLVKTGNVQAAMQLMGAVTSVLNKDRERRSPEDREQQRVERALIRESLIKEIESVGIESLESLQQTSAVISEVTSAADELTTEAKTSTAATLLAMSNFLQSSSVDVDNNRETIVESGTLIVSGLSNLLDTTTESSKTENTNDVDGSGNGTQSAAVQTDRAVTMDTLSALKGVKSALLVSKVAGESATVVHTASLTVQLSRTTPTDLAASTLPVAGDDGSGVVNEIQIPPNFTISEMTGDEMEELDTEIMQFRTNPFVWSSTSELVTSSVTDFVLRVNNSDVKVDSLDDPVNLFIPSGDPSVELPAIEANLTIDGTTIVHVNLSSNYSALLVFITSNITTDFMTSDVSGSVAVTVTKSNNDSNWAESPGNETNVSLLVPLHRLRVNGSIEPVATLAASEIGGPGPYIVSLRLQDVMDLMVERSLLQVDVRLLEARCLYWRVEEEDWVCDGCQVGPHSALYSVHCVCHHLTAFGGGVLIMPNTLDFAKDIAMFKTFWKNPVAVAFIGVVLIVYTLLVVWARRRDRDDIVKGAPIDLPDNHPLAEYPYAVTIYTGSRAGAGTTATVAIMIVGDVGRCSPHLLKTTDVITCAQGSVDIFIVRTQRPLGQLKAIRLWHDSQGKHPQWFVSRVVVEDLARSHRYSFVCDSWLGSDVGDCATDRIIPVASDHHVKQFGYIFKSRSSRGLKDRHLWVSVFTRPIHSPFSRVQRLTCCLSLLTSYMLTSIMFYGVADTLAQDQRMDIGPTVLSFNQIVIGIQTAVIALPINLIIIQLFRWSASKPPRNPYFKVVRDKFWAKVPQGGSAGGRLQEDDDGSCSLDVALSTYTLYDDLGSTCERVGSRQLYYHDRPSPPPLYDQFQYGPQGGSTCTIELHQSLRDARVVAGLAAGGQGADVSSPEILSEQLLHPDHNENVSTGDTPQPLVLNFPQSEKTFETFTHGEGMSQIRSILVQLRGELQAFQAGGKSQGNDPEVDLGNVSKSEDDFRQWYVKLGGIAHHRSSFFFQAPACHGGKLLYHENEAEENEPQETCLHISPKIFLYAAWGLVVMTTAMSAFFTILYSFNYGLDVTVSWLKSLCVSFTVDVLLEQPMKAILLAVVISVFLRRTEDEEDLMVMRSWQPTAPATVHTEDADHQWQTQRLDPAYVPPATSDVIVTDGRQKKEQKRLYSILREVGGYALFMYLILLVAHGVQDPNLYRTKVVLENTFFTTSEYLSIQTHESAWEWLRTSFVDGVFPDGAESVVANGGQVVIGSPVIRQLRVRPVHCPQTVMEKVSAGRTCMPRFSEETADRVPYGSQWADLNGTTGGSGDTAMAGPWRYTAQCGYPVQGSLMVYPLGGYCHSLGTTRSEVLESLNFSYHELWIDRATAAVITETTIYNTNTNVISLISSLFELSDISGVVPSYQVKSMRLYKATHKLHALLVAFEVIFCLYISVFMGIKVIQIVRERKQFFIKVWNWLDILMLCLSISAIGVYVQQSVEVKKVVSVYRTKPTVSLRRAFYLDSVLVAVMASIVTLGTIKFLHILRFNQRIHLFKSVLVDARPFILSYVLNTGIFDVACSSLFFLLLGTFSEHFRSFVDAGKALFLSNVAVQGGDLDPYYELHNVVGPSLFFMYYLIRLYLFSNLLITILMETMSRLAKKPLPSEDMAFVQHMGERFRHWLMLKRTKQIQPATD